MTELCASGYTTGLRFSEPQKGIATVSQGSDITLCGQFDEDALESTSSHVIDDFPPQLPFENATQDVSDVFPSQPVFPFQPVSRNATQNVPVSGNVTQQVYSLDFNNLLGIGKDITSPDPSVQMTAVRSAMSTINQLNHVTSPPSTHWRSHSTASRGFSDIPYHCPPSSQTTPFSSMSKVAKSKHRARTSALIVDTRSTSSASSV
jgi:hypothetical protein